MFLKNICRADIRGPRHAGREHGDVDARHQEPHPVWREGGEKWSVQAPRGTTSRGTYLDKKKLISQSKKCMGPSTWTFNVGPNNKCWYFGLDLIWTFRYYENWYLDNVEKRIYF